MFEKYSLKTQKVALQPLTQQHLGELFEAGQDPRLWRWILTNYCKTPEILNDWFWQTAQFDAQQQLVMAIVDQAGNKVVGTTRLFRLDTYNLSAEIGHTFIGVPWQRSYVNTHSKYLLLKYAFETLNLVRVTFCTHESNQQSRNAIARLGARFEGIHFKDRLLADGNFRNSARFSIIDEQWPEVKAKLEEQL
ncbi:GNAT family N-acetyltransferase [Pseudoalteromonas byunsanensis]|uniref:GNAT family N-acetyltransferase n=1 Tax=Pseudoalteromonas byunsanensis TaxID=327939 RepID=A0A1S1N051_9GAMM|nr:GNAT family protein [Pseudoalteromonas byunsanensis]OHU94563.1 GNAT family N-acetyltransferase [Pseudoalteromonas byunsanensis]